MAEVLLHRWNDWSAGVGHPIDEGNPGMHSANKILGLRGELRPAPVATDVTITADHGEHYQYFLEEPVSAGSTPVFDAGAKGEANNAATITWAHTVSAVKDNQLLMVGVFIDMVGSVNVSAITYGGVSMSIKASTSTATGRLVVYRLEEPPTGANNVVVTLSEAADAVGISSSWSAVDLTGPFGDSGFATDDNDAGPITIDIPSGTGEVVVDFAMCTDTIQTMTVGANQTEVTANDDRDDVRGGSSYEAGAAPTTMSWALGAASDWITYAVALVGAKPGPGYLYAQRGKKLGSNLSVKVDKVSLANYDFATADSTYYHDLTPLKLCGQPVRYHGYWWFPMGDNKKARRLQAVGVGLGSTADDIDTDTLDATGVALGADHFANLGSQVAATLKHSGNDDGGLRILKEAGDVGTEADWGPAFPVGDRTERSAGLRGLASMGFVMQIEGLHSFNKSSRAGLVFEDFRAWRHVFDNIPIVPWKGGLAMSHPTGLLFWEPGKLPVNIGLNADIGSSVLSPSGPTGLRGGRYHGLAPAGDFLYTIYQPDISSTTANVMVGYPREDSPYDLVWQQLGTTTLQDADHMLGCFVSVSSKPLSAEYVTPTLWYGNDDDLSYVVLGTTASPFRTRADTHVVEAAGDAYMSELLFEQPTELTRLVVHTQNMASGDEWYLKVLADGEEEKNLAVIKANGRHEFKIDRHAVYRLMLRANWATTVTTARAAPSIQRIELYGIPNRDFPSAG